MNAPSMVIKSSVLDDIKEYKFWYHAIDLPGGVTTPGAFDLRQYAPKALPKSLAGLRCLDVGTFDGFWSFQMEDRNAKEVVAIDLENLGQLDWPPNEVERNQAEIDQGGAILGKGFRLAAAARNSKVNRVQRSVFQLEPADIGGPVDFALVGTMLQHVRDPVGAMLRIRNAVKPGGTILMIETISTRLSLLHPRRPVADFRPTTPGSRWTWWVPNLAALKGYARTVGLVPPGDIWPCTHRLSAGHDDRLAALLCHRP